MKTLAMYGIQLWQDIAELLNKIITESGTLSQDDRSIWDGALHRWTNEDWLLIISVAERVIARRPDLANPGHRAIFEEVKRLILNYYKTEHRVMDQRKIGQDNKRAAWRCICSLRELWNNCQGINLPIPVKTRSYKRTTLWTRRT